MSRAPESSGDDWSGEHALASLTALSRGSEQIAEAQPSKAIRGRDATFRRLLLLADLGAALEALVLASVSTGQTLRWG